MKLHTKLTGTWESVRKLFVKQGGAWKPVRRGFVKVAGAWKQFYLQGVFVLFPTGAPSPNSTYPEGFQGITTTITPVPEPAAGSEVYYILRNTSSAGLGGDGQQIIQSWGHQLSYQSAPTYFGPLRVTNVTTGVSLVLINTGGGSGTWRLDTNAPDYVNFPHQQNPDRDWLRPNANDIFTFERA